MDYGINMSFADEQTGFGQHPCCIESIKDIFFSVRNKVIESFLFEICYCVIGRKSEKRKFADFKFSGEIQRVNIAEIRYEIACLPRTVEINFSAVCDPAHFVDIQMVAVAVGIDYGADISDIDIEAVH